MQSLPLTAYERFASNVNDRILSRQHLTEDSVRYSFFHALLQSTNIQQHEIILELPHPKFPGKEIDTYICPSNEMQEAFFEFKFHRASNSTSPKPQKAGSLFKDINRLASLAGSSRSCVVIYLTCSEMAAYFQANEVNYSRFWQYQTGSDFIYDQSFVTRTTPTFQKASGEHHTSRVHVEFSAALAEGHHLRVYNVRET